jgi:hypothetical protein
VCVAWVRPCILSMHAESAEIGEVASQRNGQPSGGGGGEEAGKAGSKDGSKVKVEAGAANSAQPSSNPAQHQQVCVRE